MTQPISDEQLIFLNKLPSLSDRLRQAFAWGLEPSALNKKGHADPALPKHYETLKYLQTASDVDRLCYLRNNAKKTADQKVLIRLIDDVFDVNYKRHLTNLNEAVEGLKTETPSAFNEKNWELMRRCFEQHMAPTLLLGFLKQKAPDGDISGYKEFLEAYARFVAFNQLPLPMQRHLAYTYRMKAYPSGKDHTLSTEVDSAAAEVYEEMMKFGRPELQTALDELDDFIDKTSEERLQQIGGSLFRRFYKWLLALTPEDAVDAVLLPIVQGSDEGVMTLLRIAGVFGGVFGHSHLFEELFVDNPGNDAAAFSAGVFASAFYLYLKYYRNRQLKMTTVVDQLAKTTHRDPTVVADDIYAGIENERLQELCNRLFDSSKKYEGECGFVYDETKGLPEEDIEPGTPWASLPDSWACPCCKKGKSSFHKKSSYLITLDPEKGYKLLATDVTRPLIPLPPEPWYLEEQEKTAATWLAWWRTRRLHRALSQFMAFWGLQSYLYWIVLINFGAKALNAGFVGVFASAAAGTILATALFSIGLTLLPAVAVLMYRMDRALTAYLTRRGIKNARLIAPAFSAAFAYGLSVAVFSICLLSPASILFLATAPAFLTILFAYIAPAVIPLLYLGTKAAMTHYRKRHHIPHPHDMKEGVAPAHIEQQFCLGLFVEQRIRDCLDDQDVFFEKILGKVSKKPLEDIPLPKKLVPDAKPEQLKYDYFDRVYQKKRSRLAMAILSAAVGGFVGMVFVTWPLTDLLFMVLGTVLTAPQIVPLGAVATITVFCLAMGFALYNGAIAWREGRQRQRDMEQLVEASRATQAKIADHEETCKKICRENEALLIQLNQLIGAYNKLQMTKSPAERRLLVERKPLDLILPQDKAHFFSTLEVSVDKKTRRIDRAIEGTIFVGRMGTGVLVDRIIAFGVGSIVFSVALGCLVVADVPAIFPVAFALLSVMLLASVSGLIWSSCKLYEHRWMKKISEASVVMNNMQEEENRVRRNVQLAVREQLLLKAAIQEMEKAHFTASTTLSKSGSAPVIALSEHHAPPLPTLSGHKRPLVADFVHTESSSEDDDPSPTAGVKLAKVGSSFFAGGAGSVLTHRRGKEHVDDPRRPLLSLTLEEDSPVPPPKTSAFS